jgi:hybrid cluster-associated redox disulfide protein
MFEVTKDTAIGDIILNEPVTAELFAEIGMHCIGCALSSDETVEEACAVHGVDANAFIAKLNKFIAG